MYLADNFSYAAMLPRLKLWEKLAFWMMASGEPTPKINWLSLRSQSGINAIKLILPFRIFLNV